MCACRACYLLFTQPGAARGRYRAVPDRYLTDPDHPLDGSEWDALEIPVGLAFFLHNSRAGDGHRLLPEPGGRDRVPAGPRRPGTELAADAPAARRGRTRRRGHPDHPLGLAGDGVECFVVPIDACYELAGRMRLHWRGFDGGAEARQASPSSSTVRTRAARVPVDQET